MGNVVETKVVIGVETKDATKGIDKVSDSVDNAADKFENLSMGAEGAKTVLDEATGGLATRVTNVVKGVRAMGRSFFTAFRAAITGASGLKKALFATGIGIIVAAVGTLIAYWEEIAAWFGYSTEKAEEATDQTEELTDETSNLKEETEKVKQAQEDYNKALREAKGAAKANATSLGVYLKAVKDVTAAEEDRLFALDKLKEAGIITEDVDLANAESLGLLNERVEKNIELTYARAQANAAAQYLEKEMIRLYEVQAETAQLRQDLQETFGDNTGYLADFFGGAAESGQMDNINRAKAIYKEALETLIPLEGENAEEQEKVVEKLERRANTEEAVTQALKDRISAEQSEMISMSQALDALYQEQLTAEEKELNAVADKYYQLQQYYVDDAETMKFLEEQKQKDIQDIQDKYREDREKKNDAEIDKEIANNKKLEKAKQQLALDGIGALNAIAQAALEGNDKRARLAFRINKALSLSQAIMSTSQAVTAALAQTTDPSPTQSLRFANAALAGAQGLAQIIAITRQQFNPSGGAAGGGAASVPRPSATRPALRFDAQGINSSIGLDQSPNLGNQIAESLTGNPIKAYVVSQEVQTQAKMNRKIRETATIG
jgi:hypothetical protein